MKLTVVPSITKKESFLGIRIFLEKKRPQLKYFPKNLQRFISARFRKGDLEAKERSMCTVLSDDKKLPHRMFLLVAGESKKYTSKKEREFGGLLAKEAKRCKAQTIGVWFDETLPVFPQALTEGIVLGAYQVGKPYQTGKTAEESKKREIQEIRIITKAKDISGQLEKGVQIAKATCLVRDLVNAPANLLTPKKFTEEAKRIAKESGIAIRVFEKKDLEKMKMGGILAINAGSISEEQAARLIVFEYLPLGKKVEPIIIVGKGVIFDTGGYNIKPGKYMDAMQLDKAGAAAVLGVFQVLKKLKIQKNIIGLLPVTENLVSATAYKPNDIITMYSGKTVEVLNTDAEGRMVVADALSYSIKTYKPKYIVDIATLTGACMAALGDRYAGLFGNDAKLKKILREAGKNTDELVWPMPMHPDDCAKMKSKIADLRNSDEGTTHLAGATKGAAFLKEFVGKTKWAHIDIAGTAYTLDPKKYEYPMATGFGARLLIDFLERIEV